MHAQNLTDCAGGKNFLDAPEERMEAQIEGYDHVAAGFQTEYAMAKFFRKCEGALPSVYRQQNAAVRERGLRKIEEGKFY